MFDTESQYSLFWGMKGKTYHPEVEHFENVIKGQTLVQIFDRWFAGCDDVQRKIAGELEDFEPAAGRYPYGCRNQFERR